MASRTPDKEMTDNNFTRKGDGCVECKDCGTGIRTDNLSDNEDVQSMHDSISGSCSSRCSSRLSDLSDTSTDCQIFKQAPDGIFEPKEEIKKRREATKPVKMCAKRNKVSIPLQSAQTEGQENELARELKEENKKLKLFDKCKRCQIEEATVILEPCRHLELCRGCARDVHACPVCKETIAMKCKIMSNRSENYILYEQF